MPNIDEDVTMRVLLSSVEGLRSDVQSLRAEVSSSNETKVSHREWTQRNAEVNGRFTTMGREIGDLRTELRAKSAPWWSVVALIISGGVALWTIINP